MVELLVSFGPRKWYPSRPPLTNDERKTLTAAIVRRMISRIHEEVAAYEVASALRPKETENTAASHSSESERRSEGGSL